MNIRRLYFVRPVRHPADPAASFLVIDDNRYKVIAAEVKNNGVVLTFTPKEAEGKVLGVYVPLSNISSMDIEPEAAPKK